MKASYAAIIGFCQGLLLLALHEGIERTVDIISEPIFWMPSYTLVILLPIIGIMTVSYGKHKDKAFLKLLATIAAVLLITACYTGYQINFTKEHSWGSFAFTFASVMALASFVFLAFAQNWLAGKAVNNYEQLYQHAWYNALVIAIAIIFTGLAWMVLGLWGALFNMIDIDLFSKLFIDRNFIYCATGTIFGYGIALGQQRASTIIVERIDFLFRFLLLLVSFVTILFIITLPLSGLQPLWDTRFATNLLMALQLIFIAFFNGIYQHGYSDTRQEAVWVRKLVETAAMLMPILSGISIYALWLRIDQYGWSFTRVIVALILVILAIYTIGYAAAVLYKGKRWLQLVENCNVTAAIIFIIFAILVHTPILDPKVIAASSQYNRIIEQNIIFSADYYYLRFALGKPGTNSLEKLVAADNAAIAKQAKIILAKKYRAPYFEGSQNDVATLAQAQDVPQYFRIIPAATILPASVQQYIFHKRSHSLWQNCFMQSRVDTNCVLFFADFTNNGHVDFVLIPRNNAYMALYASQGKEHTQWKKIANGDYISYSNNVNIPDFKQDSKWHSRPNPVNNLIIGDSVYTFNLERERD